MAECAFRQPSVLVLDDLDAIVGCVSGPEQENSPNALYFDRMTEGKGGSKTCVLSGSCSTLHVYLDLLFYIVNIVQDKKDLSAANGHFTEVRLVYTSKAKEKLGTIKAHMVSK